MQREPELFHPLSQIDEKALGVSLVLEASDKVVGIAHKDDIAVSMMLTPFVRPQIEEVVQVDVREQR